MTAWAGNTARALADRRGVTSIEYAMIAAGATTIVAACYNTFFSRMSKMLGAIGFRKPLRRPEPAPPGADNRGRAEAIARTLA